MRTQENFKFNTIDEVVEDLQNGKMIILVDDEDRENEGDLVIPAEKVTPESINFMASQGKGLICLPMSKDHLKRLNLEQMVVENTSPRGTAFTVSIEAKEGVTTGISAYDRSHTILTAINPDTKPEQIAKPGHVFPLKANEGGVLIRPGQTEGSVELTAMAGFSKASVICEIMDDDGKMARLPKLFQFAEKHGMKIVTIKDLIIHKLNNDSIIRKIDTQKISIQETSAEINVYRSAILNEWYISVKYGNTSNGNIPAYLHKQNVVSDILEILLTGGRNKGIFEFINSSIEEDKGVLVFLCNETDQEKNNELSDMYNENPFDIKSSDRYMFKWLRNLGVTASILKDLDINSIEIRKNNLERIKNISEFGINVVL